MLSRSDAPLAAVLIVVAAIPAAGSSLPSPAAVACDDQAFAQLDFWVGKWEVFDEVGNPQGTNRIEKVLGGCAIFEHWKDVGGNEGKSLFYYDVAAGYWKQVWVTDNATRPGGMKEKHVVEALPDGSVRFQGVINLPDGRSYLDRTTLTPLAEGRVRQHIQTSQNGGESWDDGWVGIYVPRS